MADQPILATLTGEYFQPVRLHFRVYDQDGLLRAFKKLRCLDYDRTQTRWVWLYAFEARKLRFKQSYAQLPKHFHPMVIGSFIVRKKDHLLLDLRSCERAVAAVPFFAKHLPRRIAEVTEAEVVNKLFTATGNEKLTPTSLFDQQSSTLVDPDAVVRQLTELTANITDPQERQRVALEDMEARTRKPLPEVERFPVHFYEDGIEGFANALTMRQIVALQHWSGNTSYTIFNVIQSIEKSM
jgi:hypothetical protein